MQEIITTPNTRVFEITPRGGLVTLALAFHPSTEEPEIAVMISSEDLGNTFLSRGVGPVVMARTMAHFGGQMPTVEQVLEFNEEDGADKIHQAILAGYAKADVMALWDYHQKGRQNDHLADLPPIAAEADVEPMLQLLRTQAQGNA